ncbi:MAG TPA: hypothetical protein VJ276_20310, partial [Thermoanaerobaculia bacterium]|nr:hypothetical protein [Thermoanaerobaculia bacterium]
MLVVSRANVVPLLVGRGLLPLDTVVREGVTVREVAGRNRNLAVQWPGGGCFVKQQRGAAGGDFAGIAREVALYRRAEGVAAAAPFLPRLRDALEEDSLLVFALLDAPLSVAEVHRGRRDFPG